MSVAVQYIIVAVILASAVCWIFFQFRSKKKTKDSICSGCTLYDACKYQRRECPDGEKKRHTRSVP
ncbi:MAG: FeoB-associated Cys-rich membrane protein [Muribaculaceae bacterium]|nr:FeoB-associated Cys-rich membrane protein [Muribaculaceae bacterium]